MILPTRALPSASFWNGLNRFSLYGIETDTSMIEKASLLQQGFMEILSFPK